MKEKVFPPSTTNQVHCQLSNKDHPGHLQKLLLVIFGLNDDFVISGLTVTCNQKDIMLDFISKKCSNEIMMIFLAILRK